jgi:cytochrome c-type biogenesis protein CcmH/NrfF
MHLLKRSFLLLLVAVSAFAQTASEIESDDVKRVGTHLSCQCGSCNENVDCNMSSGQCHFCKPARTEIYKKQRAGMSDEQIIASFVSQYGQKIFRPDPTSSFWIVPYASLALGGAVVLFALKKMLSGKRLVPADAAGSVPVHDDDPILAKYRETIEKETD